MKLGVDRAGNVLSAKVVFGDEGSAEAAKRDFGHGWQSNVSAISGGRIIAGVNHSRWLAAVSSSKVEPISIHLDVNLFHLCDTFIYANAYRSLN